MGSLKDRENIVPLVSYEHALSQVNVDRLSSLQSEFEPLETLQVHCGVILDQSYALFLVNILGGVYLIDLVEVSIFLTNDLVPHFFQFDPELIDSDVYELFLIHEEGCVVDNLNFFWLIMISVIDEDLISKRYLQEFIILIFIFILHFQLESKLLLAHKLVHDEVLAGIVCRRAFRHINNL